MSLTSRWASLLLLFTLVIVAGCNDDDDPVVPQEGRGNIIIVLEPNQLNAPWQLIGPHGFSLSGQGDTTLVNMVTGQYTLTWAEMQNWAAPAAETNILEIGGTLVFAGVYIVRTCHDWRINTGFQEFTPTDEQGNIIGPEAPNNWCPPDEGGEGQSPPVLPFIYPAYPNPSTGGATLIKFGLPISAGVTLRIFDDHCHIVRILIEEMLAAGVHVVAWDHRNSLGVLVDDGIYACEMVFSDFSCFGNIEVNSNP